MVAKTKVNEGYDATMKHGGKYCPNTSSLLQLLDVTIDDSIDSLLSFEDPSLTSTPPPSNQPARRRDGQQRSDRDVQDIAPASSLAELDPLMKKRHDLSDSSSVNTETLLRFLSDFSLAAYDDAHREEDKRSCCNNSQLFRKQEPREVLTAASEGHHIRRTPRFDNRSSSAAIDGGEESDHRRSFTTNAATTRGTGTTPATTAAEPALVQQRNLQQWAFQLRTALHAWVQAQRAQQERCHSDLERLLKGELRQQQAMIDSLQAVVESQQKCLQTFLASASAPTLQPPSRGPPLPTPTAASQRSCPEHGAAARPSSVSNPHERGASHSEDAGKLTRAKGNTRPFANESFRRPNVSGIFREKLAPLTTNVDPPDRRHSAHLPQAQASWLASSSFRQHELQPDGTRVTVYPNGTRKELKADGSTILHFANGDIQTVDRRGSTAAYWFADTQVVRLSHHNPLTSPSDPCVLYQFPNGQVEFHYRDGRKFVQFPNNETRWVIS